MSSILKVNTIQDGGGNAIITSDGSGNLTTLKTNFPAFEAYLGSSQTFSDQTTVKVNFNTEIFDSDSCYDASTNYRFTPTVAGKYFIYSTIAFDGRSNSNLNVVQLNIYKNGSIYKENQSYFIENYIRQISGCTNAIIDMNGSSDYVEIYAYIDMISASSDARLFGGSNKNSNFGAYRIGS
jgi:hypothetical protein